MDFGSLAEGEFYDASREHDAAANPGSHSTAIDPEFFRSAGTMPTGPVSLWPVERHLASLNGAENPERWDTADEVNGRILAAEEKLKAEKSQATEVKVGARKMISNFAQSVSHVVSNGRVSAVVREERLNTCLTCPSLIKKTSQCSECGCFVHAKTWIAGATCPSNKWEN